MPLGFPGKGNAQPAQSATPVNEQTAQAGADFLNAFGREGKSEIGQNAVAASYLTILQDLSDAVKNRAAEPGVFFNTGKQQALGTEVRVIPVAFKTVWDEKEKGGTTVARYEPYSIPVTEQPVPAGQKGYPKKINAQSGNEVVETFAYAVVLADDPSAGFLLMTAGVGSMKAFRRWNTALQQIRTPDGSAPGEIYFKVWRLVAESKVSKTTGKTFYAMTNAIDEGWVNEQLFINSVKPARIASQQLMLAAPTVADETVGAASGGEE